MASFGTTAQLLLYDTNYTLLPAVFAHSAGNENKKMWETVFGLAAEHLRSFDNSETVCIVDMEKDILTILESEAPNAVGF